MIEFIGPNGEPLTQEEWEELFHARAQNLAPESWWRKLTQVGDITISTVWIGLPIADSDIGVWETMADDHFWKFATRQEAFDHHEVLVRTLRKRKDV
jgi:hypothetical protein